MPNRPPAIARLTARIALACLLAISTACQAPQVNPPAAPPAQYLPRPPTPTAVVRGAEFVQASAGSPLPPGGGETVALDGEAPIRFVFPTQAPNPLSAWRPPLYPVPWALRPSDHFYFSRPIAADQINWPLANYRYGGIFFEDVVHTGVDIPAPSGTPVLAAGAGRVVWAGYGLLSFTPGNEDDPYGLAVAIRHDFGYQEQPLYTLYAHMEEIFVIEEQVVAAGETIGKVGETGMVTGPHLHFEVRLGANDYFATRNPELWMAPPQGWGVLAGRVLDTAGQPLERAELIVRSRAQNQFWIVMTYGPRSVNPDPYYRENVAMGDLPAGNYLLEIVYEEARYTQQIEVQPGLITFFTFRGQDGFDLSLPPTPPVNLDIEPASTP
jgi:murein DD-endopeptidase MepM/ murein hydrolase activator NlpD